MAIQVVLRHPQRRLRRSARRLVVGAGLVAVMVSLLACSVLVLFVFAAGLALLSGDGLPPLGADTVGILGAATAVAVLAGPLGRRLLRGRRRMALFLRRFGFGEATAAVTAAVRTAVGGSWRVVTLDDEQVAPVGLPAAARRLPVVGVLVGMAAVGAAAWWLASGGLETVLGGVADEVIGSPSSLQELIGGLFAALAVMLAVGALVLTLVLGGAALLGTVAVFSTGSYLAGRRSERARTVEITSAADLGAVAAAVAERARRVLAPRLVVVRVAHEVWQQAVRALAQRADTVVVDVSLLC